MTSLMMRAPSAEAPCLIVRKNCIANSNEAENLVHFLTIFNARNRFYFDFVAAQRNLIKIIEFPSRYREFQEYFDHYYDIIYTNKTIRSNNGRVTTVSA